VRLRCTNRFRFKALPARLEDPFRPSEPVSFQRIKPRRRVKLRKLAPGHLEEARDGGDKAGDLKLGD
jgi:hypothetical protein